MDVSTTTTPDELRAGLAAGDVTQRIVPVGATATLVAPFDGDRLALSFGLIAPAVQPVWSIRNFDPATEGITIKLDGTFWFTQQEHDVLVQHEHWMASAGGGLVVTVVEVFRRRKPADYQYNSSVRDMAGLARRLRRPTASFIMPPLRRPLPKWGR